MLFTKDHLRKILIFCQKAHQCWRTLKRKHSVSIDMKCTACYCYHDLAVRLLCIYLDIHFQFISFNTIPQGNNIFIHLELIKWWPIMCLSLNRQVEVNILLGCGFTWIAETLSSLFRSMHCWWLIMIMVFWSLDDRNIIMTLRFEFSWLTELKFCV